MKRLDLIMSAEQSKEYPLVTVVMAAYNAQDFISRAIESVRSQTYENWELICIDDGSSDNTRLIIEKHAVEDGRITLISQKNSGPCEARRMGYLHGVGLYFLMLDADDWLGFDALENLLADANNTKSDAVICREIHVTKNHSGKSEFLNFHHMRRGVSEGELLTGKEAFSCTFPWRIFGVALYHKDIVKSVMCDSRLCFNNFNADEYVTRRLFLNCKKVYVGSGEYFVYSNIGSLTRRRSWRHFLSLQTDRKLTDLAFSSDLNSECLRTVIYSQGQGIYWNISHLLVHGADGKVIFIIFEIFKSLIHFLKSLARYCFVYVSAALRKQSPTL
ncbi:glycosyltransferase [Yoonia sp.]|nr:glycosyltransferase family 2 protein [Yoonia sp.]MDB4240810.1 glycosyltransferase [Yoonia sp.]